METNAVFNENVEEKVEEGKKKSNGLALTLGIISIPLALIFALAGDVLGIIAIVISIVKRKEYNTIPSLVCGIIGLVLGIANSIVAITMMM